MGNFKVGDRVVCVQTHSSGRTVFKGNEYIVNEVKVCDCGIVLLGVGFYNRINGFNGTCCNSCKRPILTDTWLHSSKLFRKVEEKKEVNYVKLEIDIEEPCLN